MAETNSLRKQLHRLIIENQDETGAINRTDQSTMADEILALIASVANEAVVKELDYISQQAVITGYPKIIQERLAQLKQSEGKSNG